MRHVKIANILLEDSRPFHETPLLYVRSTEQLIDCKDGTWQLVGPGDFDFTTFFNALSVAKYDRYSSAEGYRLHLELRGGACTIIQTVADAMDYDARQKEESITHIDKSDSWQSIDIELSYEASDILVGFVIAAQETVCIRNSYYMATVADDAIRKVELALSTTTFKKENYVTNNIELVRKRVLGSNDDVANHFRMYVVDNGQTLDATALSSDGITVFPNANVGGSGGFAYGMLKAMEQQDVTHILLMDDDVELSAESIIRTFALLSIVNDDHVKSILSGAMMRYDQPNVHWEDIGHVTNEASCQPIKEPIPMDTLFGCVLNETYGNAGRTMPDADRVYAGWWYCCMPMILITERGLPLPLFVRYDDVEYALRGGDSTFMTLNGICVWHPPFPLRYSAAVERYQVTRNGLICQATTGIIPRVDLLAGLKHLIVLELIKFNYDDAELLCKSLEDYLRGPGYFSGQGVAERTFIEANREREQLLPLDRLYESAKAELGIDLSSISADEVRYDIRQRGKWLQGRAQDFLHIQQLMRTLNGQLHGNLKALRPGIPIIEGVGWSFQWDRIFGADVIIAIDVAQKCGIIRHRDNQRAKAIWTRFQADLKRYRKEDEALREQYASARGWLTSTSFWKGYLGLA